MDLVGSRRFVGRKVVMEMGRIRVNNTNGERETPIGKQIMLQLGKNRAGQACDCGIEHLTLING
jgi:hypothetical protein